MGRRRVRVAWIALLCLGSAVASGAAAQSAERPREVGLLERAEARLAQLDITVSGPPEIVGTLTARDFVIKINLRFLQEFQIDRFCEPAGADGPEEGDPAKVASVESGPSAGPAYLFYFDQPHLTLAGRQRALDIARQLVERLITAGARAMIVSNARRLDLIEPLTADPARLHAALDRLEGDLTQWDIWAEEESSRIDEVVRVMNSGEDVQRAISVAHIYQKEERWRTERNLRRLELTLELLSDLEAPKAAIYFADTMRANPGEHYLSFFGQALRSRDPALGAMAADSVTGRLPFDRVVNLASSQGIRIYAIEARGLVNEMGLELQNPGAIALTGSVASTSRVRVRDAQGALGDLATETGGAVFLHGVRGGRIAERIIADASCLYVASFDPSGFREDVPLRVVVTVNRPDVEVTARGRTVFPSESTRLTARLLRAFGTAGEIRDPFDLRVGLVPTSFDDGKYSALLQVSVPGSPLPGAAWDLGASLVSNEKVRAERSGRIQVGAPGIPVVLESEITFKPGTHEIVSVAHEANTGFVSSEETVLDWPAPGRDRAVLTPFVLIQPLSAAFLRDGETRFQGPVAIGAAEAARADRHIALVGLVCHGRRHDGPLSVERVLAGRHEASFPPLLLDLGDDRCGQVRDLLPADTLAPGYYRYDVRVSEGDVVLDRRSLEFFVRAGEPE